LSHPYANPHNPSTQISPSQNYCLPPSKTHLSFLFNPSQAFPLISLARLLQPSNHLLFIISFIIAICFNLTFSILMPLFIHNLYFQPYVKLPSQILSRVDLLLLTLNQLDLTIIYFPIFSILLVLTLYLFLFLILETLPIPSISFNEITLLN